MTKHTITKKIDQRSLNPLEPDYTYPGAKEINEKFDTYYRQRQSYTKMKDPQN